MSKPKPHKLEELAVEALQRADSVLRAPTSPQLTERALAGIQLGRELRLAAGAIEKISPARSAIGPEHLKPLRDDIVWLKEKIDFRTTGTTEAIDSLFNRIAKLEERVQQELEFARTLSSIIVDIRSGRLRVVQDEEKFAIIKAGAEG